MSSPKNDIQQSSPITQEKKVSEITTHLNDLIKKQNLPKSFFGRVSSWYYERSVWLKLAYGLLATAAGGMAGVLFMPYSIIGPVVGSIMSFITYFIPSLLLWQHHRAEKKQQEALAVEILVLKTELQESISAFNSMENSMKKVLFSMETKNQAMSKDAEALKTSVTCFATHVHDSEDALRQIQESEISIAHNTQNLANSVQELSPYSKQLDCEQKELLKINNSMYQIQAKLQKSAYAHDGLLSQIKQSADGITAVNKQYEALQNEAEKNQSLIKQHMSTLQKAIDNTPTCKETPEQQQQSNEALRKGLTNAIDNLLKERNRLYSSCARNIDVVSTTQNRAPLKAI